MKQFEKLSKRNLLNRFKNNNKTSATRVEESSVCVFLSLFSWFIIYAWGHWHPPFASFVFPPTMHCRSACWFMLMTLPVPCCNPIGQNPSWLRILISFRPRLKQSARNEPGSLQMTSFWYWKNSLVLCFAFFIIHLCKCILIWCRFI